MTLEEAMVQHDQTLLELREVLTQTGAVGQWESVRDGLIGNCYPGLSGADGPEGTAWSRSATWAAPIVSTGEATEAGIGEAKSYLRERGFVNEMLVSQGDGLTAWEISDDTKASPVRVFFGVGPNIVLSIRSSCHP